VSPTQINFQVPEELQGKAQVTAAVTVNNMTSVPQTITLASSAPAIFTANNQGTGQGAIQIANTTLFAAPIGSIPGAQSQPASKGEFIAIYCTGLGAVTNQPPTGSPASSNPLSTTIATPTVTIGGIQATVSFSGLTPGTVGLYQVNVQVPEGVPAGDTVPMVLAIGGNQSNTVTIAISGS